MSGLWARLRYGDGECCAIHPGHRVREVDGWCSLCLFEALTAPYGSYQRRREDVYLPVKLPSLWKRVICGLKNALHPDLGSAIRSYPLPKGMYWYWYAGNSRTVVGPVYDLQGQFVRYAAVLVVWSKPMADFGCTPGLHAGEDGLWYVLLVGGKESRRQVRIIVAQAVRELKLTQLLEAK